MSIQTEQLADLLSENIERELYRIDSVAMRDATVRPTTSVPPGEDEPIPIINIEVWGSGRDLGRLLHDMDGTHTDAQKGKGGVSWVIVPHESQIMSLIEELEEVEVR